MWSGGCIECGEEVQNELYYFYCPKEILIYLKITIFNIQQIQVLEMWDQHQQMTATRILRMLKYSSQLVHGVTKKEMFLCSACVYFS